MTQSPGVSRGRLVACLAGSFGWLAFAAAPAMAEVSAHQVDAAVDKAVAHLLSLQKPDGSWENEKKPNLAKVEGNDARVRNWGGETAIATYALLAAGQSPQNPQVKKAIDWLETNDLRGTYAVGLRSQVWNLIPEAARNKPVYVARDRDRDFMMASRHQKGKATGFYGYSYGDESSGSLGATMATFDPKGPPENSWYDRSNSQYGVLGSWALEQAGAEIPSSYWEEEDKAWKKAQLNDGGWNYRNEDEEGMHSRATYTMTSAGIATLFITQDYVMRANSHQFDACKGGVTNKEIEKGLAWMDKHITQAFAHNGEWYYYGLYGIERIGVASGRKYFGTFDWYKVGAEAIVRGQQPNGSWGPVHDTCFSLLFLVRGRAPVMMNKLMYETASKKQTDPWNERPRDTANLAKWMGKHSLEGYLNWQVVNLQVSVDELHDAPILYISGSEELSLSNQDIEKLRQFVEQGGMILGNADCNSIIFATSFKKLGQKLFPKYEFNRLAQSHPIFDEQYHAAKWKTHPVLETMNNGVREIMILIPDGDPGRAWQTESTKTREELFQLAGNIFLYATGKENLVAKGETYVIHPEGEGGREVKVARLQLGDNPDPEPGAWRRLAAFLHNSRHVDVKAEPVKLGTGELANYKIADLTGTTKLIFSSDQRAELKAFVDKGGTLIVDAAGGSAEFAGTAETELKTIFGTLATQDVGEQLPPTAPIYNDPQGKIEKITYRSYARRALVGGAHEGRIRGITVGNRVGVFYSREDLTAGCVGEPVDGIIGYDPSVSTQLMANIVMYAVNGPPSAKPTTAPTTTPSQSKPNPVTASPTTKPSGSQAAAK